jgi:fructose-1,6-bisphosphatase/inositol monophosphatase family enzyme
MVVVPDDKTVKRVTAAIRAVAAQEILPRFGRLAAAEIMEKAPGDLVTVADRAAERALEARLTELLPGSVVVGEEAVSADRGVLDLLRGDAPVWIIDPIDGTENYAHGNARFTVLVALAVGTELVASWIYTPCLDRMAYAVKGRGAYLEGERLRVAPPPDRARGLLDLDVIGSQPRYWEPANRAAVSRLSTHGVTMSYIDGAGTAYLALASGKRTSAVLTWDFVWDHAAGLLVHAEAGGVTMCADGSPFQLTGGNALPFVAAPDRATAEAMVAGMAVPRPDFGFAARDLHWEGCHNVRDLGGLPVAGGGRTATRRLVRADNLDRLTPRGWAALKEYGVTTVIDLRNEEECGQVERPEGIEFVRVALDAYASPEWIARWDPPGLPRNFVQYLQDYPQALVDFGKAVEAAGPGVVVVHCAAGRDRTGLASMLLLAHAGVPAEVILADYEHSMRRLLPHWAAGAEPDDIAALDEHGRARISELAREFLAGLRPEQYLGEAVRARLVSAD